MKISIACLALNLGFALWSCILIAKRAGVANTLSACCNLLLLTYALRRISRTSVNRSEEHFACARAGGHFCRDYRCASEFQWEMRLGHQTFSRNSARFLYREESPP